MKTELKRLAVSAMIILAVTLFFAGCKKDHPQADADAHDHSAHARDAGETAIAQTTCPVMVGKAIDEKMFTEYKGKKVYFCCAMCVTTFNEDPEKYIGKLPQFEASEAEEKIPDQSSATKQINCPVMDGPIDKEIFTEYKGKKVYFCCPGCDKVFNDDPEKYIAKLAQFKE